MWYNHQWVIEMKYQISKKQKTEIEEARKNNKNKQVENRLKVLFLRNEGKTYKEIAEKTGYSKANVAKIIKTYFEKGIEEISTLKYRGNHRNLSYEEEAQLLKLYENKANQGQMIEIKEIKQDYEAMVGHSIGGSQIYYVLSRHGWRKIMPRSKHPKRATSEAIEASKKLNKS